MNLRTDLAIEAFSNQKSVDGAFITEYKSGGFSVSEIEIKTEEAEKKLEKPIGTYITFESGSLAHGTVESDGAADELSKIISRFISEEGDALVVGLGNSTLTVDALGPFCVNGILATRHIEKAFLESLGLSGLRRVSAIAPGVLGQTGIETLEIIKSVCDITKPQNVIIIDALAAADTARIGNTIQINNFGIAPGSGVGNSRKELSRRTLERDVLAIGIPTVAATEDESLIITSRESDLLIKRAAELLSHALNFSLQPKIDRSLLLSLV